MEMDQVKASVGGLRKPDCKPKCLVAVFGCVLAYQNGVVHRARSAQPFEIIEDRSTASAVAARSSFAGLQIAPMNGATCRA